MLVFFAASAQAAPGFGASSSSASSDRGLMTNLVGAESPLAMLLRFIGFRQVGKAAPITDGEPDSHSGQYDCEDPKDAEAEQAAEKRNANPSGPEPVYLAF